MGACGGYEARIIVVHLELVAMLKVVRMAREWD